MLENPAPPYLKFSSAMTNYSMEISSHVPPPKPKKFPLKTSVHFQMNITICKHWSKFVTCRPSHGECGGVSRFQRHSY